jgi:hypothetical protein
MSDLIMRAIYLFWNRQRNSSGILKTGKKHLLIKSVKYFNRL